MEHMDGDHTESLQQHKNYYSQIIKTLKFKGYLRVSINEGLSQ